jgi:hypothetical protein
MDIALDKWSSKSLWTPILSLCGQPFFDIGHRSKPATRPAHLQLALPFMVQTCSSEKITRKQSGSEPDLTTILESPFHSSYTVAAESERLGVYRGGGSIGFESAQQGQLLVLRM